MQELPLRLLPGQDLRQGLEDALREAGLDSAFLVAGLGSLSDPRLRFAGAASDTVLPGPHEILSLSGTLSASGSHLHMVVADATGRVLGGHVGPGNTVRTTVEALLLGLSDWALSRQQDGTTGYKELVVRRRPGGPAR